MAQRVKLQYSHSQFIPVDMTEGEKSGGLEPKQIHWIYVMFVRPIVEYGAVAWWPKGLQQTAQAKLSSLQR